MRSVGAILLFSLVTQAHAFHDITEEEFQAMNKEDIMQTLKDLQMEHVEWRMTQGQHGEDPEKKEQGKLITDCIGRAMKVIDQNTMSALHKEFAGKHWTNVPKFLRPKVAKKIRRAMYHPVWEQYVQAKRWHYRDNHQVKTLHKVLSRLETPEPKSLKTPGWMKCPEWPWEHIYPFKETIEKSQVNPDLWSKPNVDKLVDKLVDNLVNKFVDMALPSSQVPQLPCLDPRLPGYPALQLPGSPSSTPLLHGAFEATPLQSGSNL